MFLYLLCINMYSLQVLCSGTRSRIPSFTGHSPDVPVVKSYLFLAVWRIHRGILIICIHVTIKATFAYGREKT